MLRAEQSNGKSSLFRRSSERERERERKERRETREDTSASPFPGFQHQNMKGIVREEAKKKGRRPQRRQVTFIQARRGDNRPNDHAEHAKGQGGCVFG